MFPLLRHFSLSSALLFTLASGVFLWSFWRHETQAIIASHEQNNVALARTLANTLVEGLDIHVAAVAQASGDAIRARAGTAALHARLARAIEGLPILAVKVYEPNGLTVYASELSQIGESKRGNEDFERAVASGLALSRLTFRNQLSAFSGVRANVDLVETYVPIVGASGRIEAVLELYTEVTSKLSAMRRDLAHAAAWAIAITLVTYILLLLIVRRADGMLRKQYQELAGFNSELERRVAERTAAAGRSTRELQEAHVQLLSAVAGLQRAELELLERRDGLMRQGTALRELTSQGRLTGPDWEASFRQLSETCSRVVGVERVSFWRLVEAPERIELIDLFQATPGTHVDGVTITSRDHPRYFGALRGLEPIAAADAHADPRTSELSAGHLQPGGIGAMLDVPIVRGGRLEGVLSLGHVGPMRVWTAEQQLFAASIANLAALVLEARERRRMEDDLRASNAALTVATQTKSEFLATMSHEVRTPMHGVLGMLELLGRSQLTPRQRHLASAARGCAAGLLTILNDILDLSKLEAGAVGLERLSFRLPDVVEEVVALFGPRAADRSLSLEVVVAAEAPDWVVGDPTRLRQLLFNLVGNAVKFTERGGVSVHLAARMRTADGIVARIEVVDTGIGIPQAGIARLFAQFTQADSSTTRRFGGTGLGLAISRQLTELMGGRIGVSSVEGRGSTFWIEIPLQTTEAPEEVAGGGDAGIERSGGRVLRVLVAEDNPVNRELLDAHLAAWGHEVVMAVDGVEALEKVQQGRFDLVLMDIQMPRMDGITAARRIRSLGGDLLRLPIVALTANTMNGQREEYLAAGMDDHLGKPFEVEALRATIARVTGQAAGAVAVLTDVAPVARIGERSPPPDRDAAMPAEELPLLDRRSSMEWREGLDRQTVDAILAGVPAEGGACLAELKAALARADLAAAGRAAHRLKGMAANLGAVRLAEAARRLEQDGPVSGAARVSELEHVLEATLVALRRSA